jgi:hypothetical protein
MKSWLLALMEILASCKRTKYSNILMKIWLFALVGNHSKLTPLSLPSLLSLSLSLSLSLHHNGGM